MLQRSKAELIGFPGIQRLRETRTFLSELHQRKQLTWNHCHQAHQPSSSSLSSDSISFSIFKNTPTYLHNGTKRRRNRRQPVASAARMEIRRPPSSESTHPHHHRRRRTHSISLADRGNQAHLISVAFFHPIFDGELQHPCLLLLIHQGQRREMQ